MKDAKITLEESGDSYAESAKHDRKQFLASFLISASGLILAGVGMETTMTGNAGGIFEIGVGAGLAVAFGKIGLAEIEDYADSQNSVAIRQSQIDELDEYKTDIIC